MLDSAVQGSESALLHTCPLPSGPPSQSLSQPSGSSQSILFLIFNWRIIALQCCVGFCRPQHEAATRVPSVLKLLPAPHPALGEQSSMLISLCYAAAPRQPSVSHMEGEGINATLSIRPSVSFSAVSASHRQYCPSLGCVVKKRRGY